VSTLKDLMGDRIMTSEKKGGVTAKKRLARKSTSTPSERMTLRSASDQQERERPIWLWPPLSRRCEKEKSHELF